MWWRMRGGEPEHEGIVKSRTERRKMEVYICAKCSVYEELKSG